MNTNPINSIHWFEIPVTDIKQAGALYEAMLDYKLVHSVFGDVPHAMLVSPERPGVSGALISDPKRQPKRGSGTVVYLRAPDGVARCLSRAVEAGAKVVMPVTSIGEHGTIGMIEDLDGNVVGLHQDPG